MRSFSVTTVHSFIADRHIPRDGMRILSTVSRCHWFVRVRRLGHNWSLQQVPPVYSSVWLVETEYSGGFNVGCRWWANQRPAAPVFGAECHKVNCSNVTQSQSMQHDSQLQSFSFGVLLTSKLQEHRITLMSNACHFGHACNCSDTINLCHSFAKDQHPMALDILTGVKK